MSQHYWYVIDTVPKASEWLETDDGLQWIGVSSQACSELQELTTVFAARSLRIQVKFTSCPLDG
jgi:hypothetical protein